jgi:integrase
MPLKVVTGAKPTAISALVEDFLASVKAAGRSPKTYNTSYGYPLRSILVPFCEREGITEPDQLTSKVLNRMTNELRDGGGKNGRPLTETTIHAYLRGINAGLHWARAEGEMTSKGRAQLPKLPKRLVATLDRDEIAAMEDAVSTERDKLIIRLLADTGIRVGELVALRPGDIIERDRNHYVQVHGKGSKDRLVPIPRLYRRLERFAAKGRPKDAADRLFLGLRRDRRTGQYEPLTTSGVLQMLQTAAALAGVEKRVYPHLMRHSFATYQLAKGMNPIQLQNILGHASLTMISTVYAHLSPGDAYDALLKTLTDDG